MVSVVIPIHNSEAYLGRCLDSVLGQDFDGKKEIVLVDDGSTDGSGAICDGYARKYPGISVFHTENRGASLARRFGLEKAGGEYVTFIDSDDYVSPKYISVLLNLEKRFGLDVSACRVSCPAPDNDHEEEYIEPVVLEGDELFRRFFKYEFWGLYGKLYRRSILLGIPFPEATLSEDYNVMARLLNSVGRMAYMDTPLYFYEKHDGSLSQGHFSSKSFEEFVNVKDVYEFVSSEMPGYREYALSNAVETSVKLLLASRGQAGSYRQDRKELKSFLANHRHDIYNCRPLNRKTAMLAMMPVLL